SVSHEHRAERRMALKHQEVPGHERSQSGSAYGQQKRGDCRPHASGNHVTLNLKRAHPPGAIYRKTGTLLEALLDAGIAASVGSKGYAFDNELAETVIGLYKAEVINHRGPWHGLADVERGTMEWVHWFNTERSYENLGYKSPAEYEMTYHQGSQAAA